MAQGWALMQGRAISPIIDDLVIEGWPWSDGGFEEWYFFSQLPEDLDLSAYCNWVGVSIADWAAMVDLRTGLDLKKQLEAARPYAVLGVGEWLFAISEHRVLMDEFAKLCAESHLR
jgi:hypothetical protein